MILIADSGSTKTDWCLVENGQIVRQMKTQGINPFHQSEEEVIRILQTELGVLSVDEVFFYGAGCNELQSVKMVRILRAFFVAARCVEAYSDLLGAARALCKHHEGIACILGTGANSCLYNGEKIIQNTPALGYILGDEGSGAVLGRMFINGIFKGTLPSDIRDAYLSSENLTMQDVVRKVYREPLANRFLASASLFISSHIDRKELQQLVKENFRQFIRKNLVPYKRTDLPVDFVGSIADAYRGLLVETLKEEGYMPGVVMKAPMEGLVSYHSYL